MRRAWRLGLVLGLLLLAAAAIFLTPPVRELPGAAALAWAPPSLAGWTSAEGAPEWALPVDPHERASTRRTYQRDRDTAWVAVSLFSGQQEPSRRAAINLIYPEKNTVRIDQVPFSLSLNGSPDHAVSLPAMVIHRHQAHRLLVTYWHQMGRRAYGNEYAHRLALTRDILFTRRADSVLVRIGVPMAAGEPVDRALRVAAGLGPPLWAAAARLGAGGP